MRVEVVFDDGSPTLPAARIDAITFDLRIRPRPTPDHIVETRNHQLQSSGRGREPIDARADVGLVPGNPGAAAEYIVDPDLLHAAQARLVDCCPEPEADFGVSSLSPGIPVNVGRVCAEAARADDTRAAVPKACKGFLRETLIGPLLGCAWDIAPRVI